MVLSMPSPYKHPATGVYWYRQRVPARFSTVAKGKVVIITVGGLPCSMTLGADLKVSLRTKSPAEAKRLAKEAQDEFDRVWLTFELWLTFEQGLVKLRLKQITALAGEMYHIVEGGRGQSTMALVVNEDKWI